MKKISYLFIFVFVFVVFNCNVNASTFKAGISLDKDYKNEVNLFKLLADSQSPLSKFLIQGQGDLRSRLDGYHETRFINKYAISLDYHLTKSMFMHFKKIDSSIDNDLLLSDGYLDDKLAFVVHYSPILEFFSDSFNLNSDIGPYASSDVYLFDYDMNYIGYYSVDVLKYTIPHSDSYDITRIFTYLLESNGVQFTSSYSRVVLESVNVNDTTYYIENNKNFNWFTSWFSDIFTKAYDSDDFSFDLKYFRENPLVSSSSEFYDFSDIIFYSNSVNIPDGWTGINLSSNKLGFYVLPKVDSIPESCSSRMYCTDLGFYMYKTNKIQNILLGSFDYKTNNAFIFKDNFTYYQYTIAPFKSTFMYDGGIIDSEYLVKTFYPDYAFQFYSDNINYDAYIYYNPDYYYSIPVKETSQTINILGHNVVTGDGKTTANQIYEDAKSDIKYTGSLSDLNEWTSSQGQSSWSGDGTGGSSSNLFNKDYLSNSIKSFLGSISSIGAIISEIFSSFPSEITNVLIFSFTISVVIAILKILI